MKLIVGVRFKKAGKIYYFDPGNEILEVHDGVIVETARGIEFGEVVIAPRYIDDGQFTSPLKMVLRKATEADYITLERNKEKEKKAFAIGLEKIQKHKLPMKLIDVEYTFNLSKVTFFFTADGRVDFRDLVKDLAPIFKTRVELRQVGVRDEAKVLNGIGNCGRTLCCATFLGDFAPVSIKMVKNQNLSLNPTKISGVCGRLLCCLHYENEQYKKGGDLYVEREKKVAVEEGVSLPGIGKTVMTEEGEGKVLHINYKNHTVKIQLDEGRSITIPWSEMACYIEEE